MKIKQSIKIQHKNKNVLDELNNRDDRGQNQQISTKQYNLYNLNNKEKIDCEQINK